MKLRNKKTGEIVSLSIFGISLNIRKEEQPTYHSIEQLCEDWEDVKEPLIKDQKIRKAVRAWAEANDYPKTMGLYYNAPNFVLRSDISTIEFDKEIEPLQHGEEHTIEELCGSEEIEILEPTYTTIEEKERLKEQE